MIDNCCSGPKKYNKSEGDINSWCAERGGRISQVVPPPSAQKSADNGDRLPIKVVGTTIAQRSVYTINTTKKEPGFNFLRFSPSIHWIVRFCKG